MKATVLSTISEKCMGVLSRKSLDDDEIFIFKGISPKTAFHMSGVTFPIKIAFLDRDCSILGISDLEPHTGTACAPEDTAYAVEASPSYFSLNGIKVGEVWKAVYNELSKK